MILAGYLADVIDGRTIKKISAGFDFDAIERGGRGRVLIEAKGTFRDATTSDHRSSIYKKLLNEGLPRGYSRAIGVITSLWTATNVRDFDVEICDPEEPAESHFEQAVREIIRFYARRFEEAVAIRQGVELLFQAASSPDLFDKRKPSPLPEATTNRGRLIGPLRHNTLRLNRLGWFRSFGEDSGKLASCLYHYLFETATKLSHSVDVNSRLPRGEPWRLPRREIRYKHPPLHSK